MSDTGTPTTPTTESAPAATAPEATPQTFSLEYVQELRGEAAKYRNEKKDAVEQAKSAVAQEWEGKLTASQSEVSRLTNDLGDAWIELAKLHAAIEVGAPSDKILNVAALLKGSDADSIKASAQSVKELFGGFKTTSPAVDPTQGSGGGAMPLNGDPILAALTKAVGG